jgi:hypothetical protein
MRNRLKELQRFDEANGLMAQRVIENPEQFHPRVRKWARAVMLEQGTHFARSIQHAKNGLALLQQTEGKGQ